MLAAVLLSAFALAAQAQGPGIQVTIDRPEATIQDQLLLSVTVSGSRTAVPQLPDLPDFQVYSRGQSSQISMGGGQTSVSITHSYLLVPRRTGSFTIGPSTVEIDGRTYRSQPFRVRIVEATAEPRQAQEAFVTAEVSNRSPYVGEQVIYTWRFLRRVQVADAQLVAMDFEGFLVEDLGDSDKVKEYTVTRGGQQYLVSEIKKALFPQEEGKLTIPPTVLQCQVVVETRSRRRSVFDDFFGRRQAEARTLSTPAIEVDVRPLPAAPGGFSGLVGSFELGSRISKRQLKVGESATWKLTVAGTGNVRMIGEPKLPDLSRFKVYDDKPSSSIERAGAELRGSRAYSKALVPLEAGSLTVPPVTLTYFDPAAGSYRQASTAPIVLEVAPAEGKEELRLTESVAPSTGKVAVRILADDILPLAKGLDAVAGPPFGHRIDAPWLGALVAPPFLYFALLWFERRRRHFEANAGLRRQRLAWKRARRALGEVDAAAARGEHRAAAQRTSRLVREYVGDKVDLEGGALTPAEVEAHLQRFGVGEELAGEARRLLEGLDGLQYGGGGGERAGQLIAGVRPLLKRLEGRIGVKSR